jgi:hypothetical protein
VFSPKHRHTPKAVEEPPQSKSLRRKRREPPAEERHRLWTGRPAREARLPIELQMATTFEKPIAGCRVTTLFPKLP